MRLVAEKHFGHTAVERVVIRKKDGLVLLQSGGMRRARVGRILNGPHVGRYMLYLAHTETPADYYGTRYWFVPDDAIIAEVEPDVDEVVEALVEVDERTGKDDAWYGNVA